MWLALKRLFLGFFLIALTSSVLLVTDWNRRKPTDSPAGNRPAATPGGVTKKWLINLVEFNNVSDVEEAEHGALVGLREAGLVEGRDYAVVIRNAQGDMGTVNSLIDAAITEGADLLITLSTPTLQAALQRARNLPIVFTYASFPSIAQAARRTKLPIFAFQSSQAHAGAIVVLARDYADGGREAGLLAARIMRGENPATIPFQGVKKTRLIVNLEAARSLGLALPPALIKQAEEVIGQ